MDAYQSLLKKRDELFRQCNPDADFAAELKKHPISEQIFCLALVLGMRKERNQTTTFH